jgi:hypothetical protein
MIPGLSKLVGLARADGDVRAHLAERLGDLQAEAARAAGYKCNAAGEIQEIANIHAPASYR